MYKSKQLNTIITLIIFVTTLPIAICLFVFRAGMVSGYQNMYILPLIYLLTYLLFIRPTLNNYGLSLFLAVYLSVSYLRYNILSYLIFKSGWYTGISKISPTPEQFNHAIYLMAYEILIYSIAIWLFHKLLIKKVYKMKVSFQKDNFIYGIAIFLTILVIAIRPTALQFFSFIKINPNYQTVENLDTMSLIGIVLLSITRFLIYFILVKWIVEKIKPKYYLTSFVLVGSISLINSMIFVGTNRASFLLNFVATLLILIILYRKVALIFSGIMIVILPFLFGSLTEYRQTTTITGGSSKLIDLTDTLQVYLGGIYNVATSLDLHTPNGGPLYLILDLLRSAIGPGLLVKNISFINSVSLFNERIFQSSLVSQIIPMIGQGELYLGVILSPLLGVFFIFIAVYFTKIIVDKSRFELIFVFTLICGRLGFIMAQNGNIFMNELTFYLPLFLLIYYINNKVVINK